MTRTAPPKSRKKLPPDTPDSDQHDSDRPAAASPASETDPGASLAPAETATADSSEQNRAFKELRRALSKEVLAKSTKIAASLVQNTIDGNSNSARIVVGLVDKRKRSKTAMSRLKKAALNAKPTQSVARDLAADPEWKDEEIDHSAGNPAVSEEERRYSDDPDASKNF